MNQRLAYATQRAEVLFGSYRRGDANDPERYVAAVAAVLSSYEFDLIREVTDPRTGICATEKFMTFMPNAGELKVYCDAIAAQRERIQRLGQMPRPDFSRERLAPPPPVPGDLASIFVPEGHARYPSLVKWSAGADPRNFKFGRSSDNRVGIWIAWNVWEDRQKATRSMGDVAKEIAADVAPAPPSHEAAGG